jgi:S1-C subfamily serine protease
VKGVIVIGVVPGSPAAKAGLRGIEQSADGIRIGDVIVAIGGEAVKDYDDLYNLLDKRRPGDTVEVTILRGGKPEKVTMQTVALP